MYDNNHSSDSEVKSNTSKKKEQTETREIPLEIDDHFKLFGKEPWEVEYGTKCTECKSRTDEFGFCACGSSGE